jgi:uncharacterized RDD family membrane protein YckC
MEIYIAKDGKESGPYTADEIESLYQAHMIGLNDHVWHEGLEGWVPLYRFLGGRPPIPPLAEESTRANQGGNPVRYASGRAGEPAGLFVKAGAYLIDYGMIFVFVTIPLLMLWKKIAGGTIRDLMDFSNQAGEPGEALVLDWQIGFLAYFVTNIIPRWFYVTAMESSSKQATLGKVALGLRVTDVSGGSPTRAQVGIRFVGMAVTECLPAIICMSFVKPWTPVFPDLLPDLTWGGPTTVYLGLLIYVLCAFSERKQCLHDKLAGTLVVRR